MKLSFFFSLGAFSAVESQINEDRPNFILLVSLELFYASFGAELTKTDMEFSILHAAPPEL